MNDLVVGPNAHLQRNTAAIGHPAVDRNRAALIDGDVERTRGVPIRISGGIGQVGASSFAIGQWNAIGDGTTDERRRPGVGLDEAVAAAILDFTTTTARARKPPQPTIGDIARSAAACKQAVSICRVVAEAVSYTHLTLPTTPYV